MGEAPWEGGAGREACGPEGLLTLEALKAGLLEGEQVDVRVLESERGFQSMEKGERGASLRCSRSGLTESST